MKRSKFMLYLLTNIRLTSPSRLDYLTNVLGYDAASSKKLIAQKEKSR
jgi:hypothetical protein